MSLFVSSHQKNKITFDDFFKVIYDSRWESLRSALLIQEKQVLRWNQWVCTSTPAPHIELKELTMCSWKNQGEFFEPQRASMNEESLLNCYVMDPASVVAARALGVKDGDQVLDVCAAPGGKSLILIEALKTSGEIILNDLSPERRERLKKVIQNYVPRDVRNRVWIKGQDGVQFGLKMKDHFDKILLDAPCSGERHLLENEKAMKEWGPRRTEHLAGRQYSLLCSALLALKSEGTMIYSTCTLSPEENDGVLRKLLKKKSDQVEIDLDFLNTAQTHQENSIMSLAEKTEFGFIFLPDKCGFGPLFISRLKKKS